MLVDSGSELERITALNSHQLMSLSTQGNQQTRTHRPNKTQVLLEAGGHAAIPGFITTRLYEYHATGDGLGFSTPTRSGM